MNDPFLTRDEKRKIQKMYDKWNSYAKADILAEKLYAEGILHEREMQVCKGKDTMHGKNSYLYDTVVSRSTYDRICKLRQILYDMEDGAHTELANMLPQRNPVDQKQKYGMQWDTYPNTNTGYTQYQHYYDSTNYTPGYGGEQGHHTGYSTNVGGNTGFTTTNQKNMPGHPTSDATYQTTNVGGVGSEPRGQPNPQPGSNSWRQNDTQYPEDKEEDRKYSYGHQPRADVLEQESGGRSQTAPKKQQTSDSREPTSDSDREKKSGIKKLNVYSTRPNNPSSGRGLCVVIANFTDDLQGYKSDIRLITDFFGKTLNYTVLGGADTDAAGYRDLTTAQCKEKMTWLKKEMENGQYKSYDRFFLFVLSHGDELGIKMIPPPGKNDNAMRDRIKSEFLVETFAHGELPNLKSFPKCFFIQVCSGAEIAKAAHGSATDKAEEHRSPVVAVGADTLVCHAAKEGKYSWVSQGEAAGSWFLHSTLKVFREYYQTEHILDMLTEVNDRVSKKHGLANVKTKYSNEPELKKVHQLPAISNNLTKKLYL